MAPPILMPARVGDAFDRANIAAAPSEVLNRTQPA